MKLKFSPKGNCEMLKLNLKGKKGWHVKGNLSSKGSAKKKRVKRKKLKCSAKKRQENAQLLKQ